MVQVGVPAMMDDSYRQNGSDGSLTELEKEVTKEHIEMVRRKLESHSVNETAGTYADEAHVHTADDAVAETCKVLSRHHHELANSEEPSAMARLLKSTRFEGILSIVICLNMVFIIIETDLTADGQAPPLWMSTTNLAFLSVYVVECTTKICVFRFAFFRDTWNLIDLLVVFCDACLSALNFLEGVERVSVIRIFRLVKLFRAVRVLRQVWELKILMLGFSAAAKSIVFGLGMVLVMTLVWSILGVQIIHPINAEIWADSDCDRCRRAYATVFNGMVTIFQTSVAGDSWGVLAVPIIEREWWTSAWFLSVLGTVQLTMLNLILAVIVERAADAREREVKRGIKDKEEAMLKGKLRLLELCRTLDTDQSGSLSRAEFLQGFENNSEFAAAVLQMGVYPEDVELLFDVLDIRGSGEVSYVSFVNTLARLRTQMSQVILFSITDMRKAMSEFHDSIEKLKADILPSCGQPGEWSHDNCNPVMRKPEKQQAAKEMQVTAEALLDISQSFGAAERLVAESSARSFPAENLLEALSTDLDVALQMLKNLEVPGLNDLDDKGETTLLRAIKQQSWEVAKAILSRPDFSQANVKDAFGLDAFQLALRAKQRDVCDLIEQLPSSVLEGNLSF